jgi:GntR family transcriptional repressor for pyruvate dehydrogenase complex
MERLNKKPVPTPTSGDLTAVLVAGLRQLIADGTFHPGSKLPPERDVARRFSVNRSTVRQAWKALEVMGVLRQRVGDGTYLTADASAILSAPLDFLLLVEGITFRELYAARRIFEPELAARAALRRTDHEITQLAETVTEMKRQFELGSLQGVASCDRRFHSLIWQAAGNRICLRMLVPLHRTMTNSFALRWSAGDYANAIASHLGILEAIEAGDPELARHRMNEHLDRAEFVFVSDARDRPAAATGAAVPPRELGCPRTTLGVLG